jgi:hypothetical protein
MRRQVDRTKFNPTALVLFTIAISLMIWSYYS